jgi:anti-sigma-K factor RskA
MFEEDQDALAAEYVLGTLSADERAHAEALLSFDPGFEAAVRQWERRLGELNVMVEAVEPPAELWDKLKKEVAPEAPPPLPEGLLGASTEAAAEPEAEAEVAGPRDVDAPSTLAAMASDLAAADTASAHAGERAGHTHDDASLLPPSLLPELQGVEPRADSDVVDFPKRAGPWRGLTIASGAIAALLAAYVAVSQVAPDLIPPPLRGAGVRPVARTDGGERAQQDRLVAVLQQQPTAPAFLLTVDTVTRTLVVRRVSATMEPNRSYELWLIPDRTSAPRSLGVVGAEEFTRRPLPANVDVDALRSGSFAVSLEPSGGSPSGAPTGPVLFTGKAVESLPAAEQQKKT